jgi:hypothetical protein
MRAGRIRRNARRGVVALVLGWLAVMVGSLLMAPNAGAAPTATVYIRDLTPPLVSVDKNGTVTFVNQIQDKNIQVGGGGLLPSVVTATVHTDVTLALPSGKYTLKSQPDTDPNPEKDSSVAEKFGQSCVTCTITYTYRVTFANTSIVGNVLNTLTGQALAQLPQNQVVTYNGKQTTVTIGVPTPFIVNTLLPLPNLPSVNVPSQVQVTVPAPTGLPKAGGTVGGLTGTVTTTTTTTTTTTVTGINGAQYQYLSGLGAPRMAPAGRAASSAIDQVRTVTGGGSSAGSPGAQQGAYDTTPVFALDGTKLKNADASSAVGRQQTRPLSVPALLAVIVLAAAVAGLIMVQRARRAAGRKR